MRAAYEARLQALEQRLRRAEAALATPAVPAAAAAASAPAAPVVAAETGTAPPAEVAATVPAPAPAAVAATGATGGANAFNPAMSLILSGLYTNTSRDPANYRITGFPLPPDARDRPRHPRLQPRRIASSASPPTSTRGSAAPPTSPSRPTTMFRSRRRMSQTTSLGKGLSLKAGPLLLRRRLPQLAARPHLGLRRRAAGLPGVPRHAVRGRRPAAQLACADRPVHRARAEVGRGRTFPGSDTSRNGAGMMRSPRTWAATSARATAGAPACRTCTPRRTRSTWSRLNAAGDPVTNSFTGSSHVWVADAVWKWAPNGNATRTNFKLQGEYLQSTRERQPGLHAGGAAAPGTYARRNRAGTCRACTSSCRAGASACAPSG